MSNLYENVCRLCAKENNELIDVLHSDGEGLIPDLADVIKRHFAISINPDEPAPTTICKDCCDFIDELVKFAERVLHTQSTFDQMKPEFEEFDIDTLDNNDLIELTAEKLEPDKPSFDCDKCDRVFPTQKGCRTHMKTHENVETFCDICGTKFSKESYRLNHMRLVHSNERPYICEECGKGFKRSGDLNRHKEFHRDDTPFSCSFCDKKFKSKLVVKMHEKLHTSAKYNCHVCGLELKTKLTLKGHMRTHSSDMQFQCTYCDKKFKFKKNLTCHMITHSGLQPFSCIFCKQSFSLRWNCRTHQRNVHPQEYARYVSEGKSTIETAVVKQKFACVPKLAVDNYAL